MSAMLAVPPSTRAVIWSISVWVRSASGSISGVMREAPAGIRFGGTATRGGAGATASPAGLAVWNTACTVTAMPRSRSFCTSVTASSEWPPRAKKSSSGPTRVRPRTSANTRQMISSRIVAGPRLVCPSAQSGARSAALSITPLSVSGSASRTTTAAGTIYPSRRAATCWRTAAARPPRLWPGVGIM
jgi:hypothetical protein